MKITVILRIEIIGIEHHVEDAVAESTMQTNLKAFDFRRPAAWGG